jgi:WD40 repeat protein
MITKKLDFNAYLVWSTEEGFHTFGHHSTGLTIRRYKYETPRDGFRMLDSFRERTYYFNHVEPSEWTDSSFRISHRHYCAFINKHSSELGFVEVKPHNKIFEEVLPKIKSKYPKDCHGHAAFDCLCRYKTPSKSANFDYLGDNLVFAWGHSLWINHYHYGTSERCNDAKISPDGETVAFAVGNEIRFMDIVTKRIRYRIDNKDRVSHLAYSKDGLTIAAIVGTNKLVIWDVE